MKYLLIAVLFLIFGCEKEFENKELNEIPDNCELCDFADSLNGVYLGEICGIFLPSGVNCNDSCSYTVQHVFLPENGSYIDSTIMFFNVEQKIYTSSVIKNSIVAIENRTGNVIDPEFKNYTIQPNKLKILDDFSGKYGYVVVLSFTGYK